MSGGYGVRRRTALALITGLALLSACASAPEAPPHAPVSVTFEQGPQGHIVIPVVIAGVAGFASFDNGAPQSVLDRKFAEEHGLVSKDGRLGGGFLMGEPVAIAVGGVTETSVPIIVDLSPVGPQRPMFGVVGAEFFRGHVVELDFTQKRLTFHDRRTFTAPPGFTQIPLTSRRGDGHLHFPGAVEGKGGYQIGFDLGGHGVAAVKEGGKGEALIAGRPSTSTPPAYAYRSGKLTPFYGRAFTLGEISFAGFTLRDVPTNLLDQYSIPGADIRIDVNALSRFDLIFDIDGRRVWMRPNATYDEPFPHNLFGIGLNPGPVAGTLRVTTVGEGSPAEKAGVKVGDIITRFDGVVPTVANMIALENTAPEPKVGYVLEIELQDGRTLRIVAARFY